jgi:uncharacterized protein YjdB
MRTSLLAMTGVCLALIGCKGGETSTVIVEKTPVASVSVTIPSKSLTVGQTENGRATPLDASGNPLSDRAVTWTSSSANIAKVDGSGVISAMAAGSATISAQSEGVSGHADVSVADGVVPPAPVATVSVSLGAASLNPGQTTQATATPRDASNNVLAGRTVTWSSSNTGVASVNASGLVTAVAVGTAQIIGTSEGQTGNATLTVAAPPPVPVASVSVSLAASSLTPGQTTQASATTRDANNNILTGRSITWSSSNTAVATVSSSGLVTALAVGTVQIIAACEGKTASGTLTIATGAPAPVATVTVSFNVASINVAQTTQATATTLDANNNVLTDRVVSWSSDNQAVATVSSSGVVTGVASGTASITATSEGKSGSATINVRAQGATNEPGGMTVISDRPFNALNELGWADEGNGGSFIQDATAPHSPNSIYHTVLPAGFQGGGGTAWGEINFNVKTIYVSYWARESANWEGHEGSLTNKRFYIYTTTDVPSIFISMEGSGSGPLRPYIEGQNITTGGAGYGDPQNPDWGPNLVPTAEAVRGVWHNLELVAAMNSVGKADGYLDLWLDGVHISHYTGIMFQSSSPSWRLLHYTNLWGGGGGTVAQTMWLDWDHLYISGK